MNWFRNVPDSFVPETADARTLRVFHCHELNTPLQTTGYQTCNAAEQKASKGHFGI